jgi:hypothetical protein
MRDRKKSAPVVHFAVCGSDAALRAIWNEPDMPRLEVFCSGDASSVTLSWEILPTLFGNERSLVIPLAPTIHKFKKRHESNALSL